MCKEGKTDGLATPACTSVSSHWATQGVAIGEGSQPMRDPASFVRLDKLRWTLNNFVQRNHRWHEQADEPHIS